MKWLEISLQWQEAFQGADNMWHLGNPEMHPKSRKPLTTNFRRLRKPYNSPWFWSILHHSNLWGWLLFWSASYHLLPRAVRTGISRSLMFKSWSSRLIQQILQSLYLCYNAPTVHNIQVLSSYTTCVSLRGRLLPPVSHPFQLNPPFFSCFTLHSCLPRVSLISPTQCHTQAAILALSYQTLWV